MLFERKDMQDPDQPVLAWSAESKRAGEGVRYCEVMKLLKQFNFLGASLSCPCQPAAGLIPPRLPCNHHAILTAGGGLRLR